MSAVLILRPQPGADETAARARARGIEPVAAPLFTIRPADWVPPPPDRFDAVLFTSANGPRLAGPQLRFYAHLPCYAVGEATALAAGEAGFSDVRIGPSDGEAVAQMMAADGIRRAFHPTLDEPAALSATGVEIEQATVYIAEASDRLPDVAVAAINAGAVALLHSPRAATAFSDLIGERRSQTRVAAISDNAAAAAGNGWAGAATAAEPRDDALLTAAEALWSDETPAKGDLVEPPTATAVRSAQPRRRSWLLTPLLLLIAFLLGIAATASLLTRWEAAADMLGLAPPPVAVGAPPAPQASILQPSGPQPQVPTPDGSTIVIDPEVARRVGALEQRVGEVDQDSRSAVGNADRAEGLLVAFAARRALDRGVGLGYIEGLLRQRFGSNQPQAVGTIITAARAPVTLQQLQEGLQEVAPDLVSAAPGQSFFNALEAELAALIIIRRGGTPSTDPRERLRRATSRLEAGQVEIALAEVLRLPGHDNGRQWIDAAQRYVAARQALDTIEVAALLEPRMPPQEGQDAQQMRLE